MRRRVVITGMGIWSCLGQTLETVAENLKQGYSGIVYDQNIIDYGLQSGLIANVPMPDLKTLLPREYRAAMSLDAQYAYMAAQQAFEQAGITDSYLQSNTIGCIFGGDGNFEGLEDIKRIEEKHSSSEVDLFSFIRFNASNSSLILSMLFHLMGVEFCVGAACASSSHAIGIGKMFIESGMNDILLVGGSCPVQLGSSVAVDNIGATSLRNNDPQRASRPFDKNRDGFVPSGGAAALVLEGYEHAIARGATIWAEVCGYGFSSNGTEEISAPSADGEYKAMKRALDDAGLQPSDIDYVNAHGTSTPLGDIEEAKALTRLFVDGNTLITHHSSLINRKPFISSTKSMTGHENWMAGASEAVYSILMMQNNFVAPNINLENVIDEAKDLNIARETIYTPINTVLSNSSGMGGTNSALVFRKIENGK